MNVLIRRTKMSRPTFPGVAGLNVFLRFPKKLEPGCVYLRCGSLERVVRHARSQFGETADSDTIEGLLNTPKFTIVWLNNAALQVTQSAL
jgi:hypothetical protein